MWHFDQILNYIIVRLAYHLWCSKRGLDAAVHQDNIANINNSRRSWAICFLYEIFQSLLYLDFWVWIKMNPENLFHHIYVYCYFIIHSKNQSWEIILWTWAPCTKEFLKSIRFKQNDLILQFSNHAWWSCYMTPQPLSNRQFATFLTHCLSTSRTKTTRKSRDF